MTAETIYANKCKSKYNCSNCLKTVGIVGFVGNIFLAVLKIFVGLSFFSVALLADALYSLLDVGYSLLIIVGLKISAKPPDKDHDFGHGKIEFVITLAFSVMTILGALALFTYALIELHEGMLGTFSGYVLLAAVISSIANYLFYRFSSCIGSQFDSPSIVSLAMHSKADAISSVLVIISMIFAYWGYHHVGPIVALIETVHILIIGSEIFKGSLYGLLDASISKNDIRKIKGVLNSINGIRNVNYVKSRKIGHKVWLNIEIELPPSINISMADAIKSDINDSIREELKNIEDVLVNVVPCRDEIESELSLAGSQTESA